MRMLGIRGIPADEVIERRLRCGNALRFQVAILQSGPHFVVIGRLMNAGVLAFHVEQDHGHSGRLGLLDQPGNRGRFPRPGGTQHGEMSWQHCLFIGRHFDEYIAVADHAAETNVALGTQNLDRFLIAERGHRAIGQWPQARGSQRAVFQFLAENGDVQTAMIGRQVDAAASRHGNQQVGIGAQAIWLGERASRHHPEVLSAITALDAQSAPATAPLSVGLAAARR